MKRLGIAICGKSGSGKTTLILKIAHNLISHGFKVAIIKHDPGDKAIFGDENKDSVKFSKIGANVAVASPRRLSVFLNEGVFGGEGRINSPAHDNKSENFGELENFGRESDLNAVISHFGDFDYLIVEGLKFIPLPRICVFRGEIAGEFLNFGDAFVSDVAGFSFENREIFGLDDIEKIIAWIDKSAKKL